MAGVFLVRDKEIKTLFDKIANQPQSRTAVVYGQLGVGKTSLVLAGLLPRLKEYFTCHYVRCNKSTVQKILGNSLSAYENFDLYDSLISKEKQTDEQEIILFDQFEAFYIWVKEQNLLNTFYRLVEKLLAQKPNLKLVFVVREDYFAQLSEFETVLPNLMDSRIRVEAINHNQAFESL